MKMRQFPGDIPKQNKAALLEGTCDPCDLWRAKGFKKRLRMRERAVLNERARQEIVRQLSASEEEESKS